MRVEPAGWPGVSLRSARNEARAKLDRPVLPPGSPRDVTLRFLLAVSRGELEAAGALVDWPQLAKAQKHSGDLKAFRARFLTRIARASSELDEDAVAGLAPHLRAEGKHPTRRTVRIPNEATRFELALGSKGWKIVDLH